MLCSRVQNLLSAYCDRELTGAEMLHLRSHLDRCSACESERLALLQVKQVLGALPPVEPRLPFDARSAPVRPHWLVQCARALSQPIVLNFDGLLPELPDWMNRPVGRLGTAAALGGAVLAAFLVGLVQTPQPPDTVTAQVPPFVAADSELRTAGLAGGGAGAMPVAQYERRTPAAPGAYLSPEELSRMRYGPNETSGFAVFTIVTPWRKVESR